MVFSGLVTAWRLAGWPTRRSPSSLKATIEGVVRMPSAFSMTLGVLPSMTATHELVVPRSMPMTLPMVLPLKICGGPGGPLGARAGFHGSSADPLIQPPGYAFCRISAANGSYRRARGGRKMHRQAFLIDLLRRSLAAVGPAQNKHVADRFIRAIGLQQLGQHRIRTRPSQPIDVFH